MAANVVPYVTAIPGDSSVLHARTKILRPVKFGGGEDDEATRSLGGLRAPGDQGLSVSKYGQRFTGAGSIQASRLLPGAC